MPQHIEVPGLGIVEFPDGMTDAQIETAIKANVPRGATGDFGPDKNTNLEYGALKGVSRAGRTIMNAGASLLPKEAQDWLHQKQEEGDRELATRADPNSVAFKVGDVAGSVAGTAGPVRAV